MKTREERRRERRMDLWAVLVWIVVAVILVLVLTAEALDPAPEPPSDQERAAQFVAQETYYDTLDRYGDLEGAVEVARLVWEGKP